MNFSDIKIKSQEKAKEEKKTKITSDSSDFIVSGAEVGQDILDDFRTKGKKKEKVIYGVYDNSDKGVFVKLNDFLIDRSKVTLKNKSYFFHMLAVMVDAGIPVVRAVKSLAYRASNPRFQRVLNTIAHSCEHGATLADAMMRFDDVFDEAEIGIVRAGEATGSLHTMLFKLSSQLDKRHDLYLKLWSAAVYPIAVLVVLVIVAVGMLLWIFPTLLNLLSEGGLTTEQLPSSTRFLLAIQTGLTDYWWAILMVIFFFYGIFNLYKNSSAGAVSWDATKLDIPILGKLIKKLNVLRFVSMLGILIDAGLPVIKTLRITGNSLTNRIYKLKAQEVINRVRVGDKISSSLRDSEVIFPPEVVEMLAVGEESANIAKVSGKIADQYQREIDNTLKKLTSVFEPVMILFVGLFVALLAMAIMAPIFNLSSTLGY